MKSLTMPLCLISLLLTAALFGFFYAWVCSTMWGLDAADPRVAIAAMQAMNGSVRNAVFAPAFFGTPVALLVTTALLAATSQRGAWPWFAMATALSALLGVALTMAINVPMNEELARITIPQDIDTARALWLAYSPDWQFWNQMRTVATGVAVLCIGVGFTRLNRS
ncbi:DUF1772 domain-containing protein [Sulfitobacter sp. M57]|uniref:anthrone oxygenase family protein n=1 Tax=unclassified Sulfitobacter TaxID=196795 RepID=UPI0023E13FB5|nr:MULTISPECIES: anthrone oxygenase family protein [unclassified Sulfitobacter]MDF3415431.1 DUF1772 domain-containing protein [Sulfitobacter sp. KE5]MDF3422912.1 DUF1772 domain-containing protein [Sulfitobacter sp. KE43]MDF3433977.1 DUF1772 domain-containing protein [Sulfitobacter sp. KE42]MDF3459617.1 DUF1772 domain-containing protein [Sulfitobacter sp. S74]MDF3463516.1 DUF1772 domain-containing protein [Sulfitobacter sp. Ks18]